MQASARRRQQEQLARRHLVRDLVGDPVAEAARQVLDGVFAQVLESLHVRLSFGVELVEPQKAVDLVEVLERHVMPVDDRAAAEQQTEAFDVRE